ncbi:MAG: NAD(+)/NADH kinase [Caldilineales bacterium]
MENSQRQPELKPVRNVGILHHPRKPGSLDLAEEMAAFIRGNGGTAWLESAWNEDGIVARLADQPPLDMLVTLGGDGTILRAARTGAQHAAPILGVKLGRLGFLAEVEPDNWTAPLASIMGGGYWLERRMMLDACLRRNGVQPGAPEEHFQALNEVVVSRGRLARIVRVATWIDGDYLTSYAADGVIVSTPTGSTGYGLAAGGPILPPELRNIVIVPIAAHLSLDRAVVLAEGSTVRLEVSADHQVILSVDGQFDVEMFTGDTVEVNASASSARFVRVRSPAYFYRSLMQRLKWNL